MSRLNIPICALAAIVWSTAAAGAFAQGEKSAESMSVAGARHLPGESPVGIEKECLDADGANVCWLQFKDGTRCVVASTSDSADNSTALNCHFSTPMERLHRMPKE